MLICWHRSFPLPAQAWLLVPVAFGVQATVFFFAIILSEQLRRAAWIRNSVQKPDSTEPAPVLRSLIVLPGDYGVLCLAFLTLGLHPVFRWVYGLLMLAGFLLLAVAVPRWYREMRSF